MKRMIRSAGFSTLILGLGFASLPAQPTGFDSAAPGRGLTAIVAGLRRAAASGVSPTPKAAQLVIPAPSGVLQKLNRADMKRLQAAAAVVAVIVPPDSSWSNDYSRTLLGCTNTQGGTTLASTEAGTFLGRYPYSNQRASAQMSAYNDQFTSQAFQLAVDMHLGTDGAQYEKSVTVGRYQGATFTILPDGRVSYTTPDQLAAQAQWTLKEAVAFWIKVGAGAITKSAVYDNLLNKDFVCAP